METQNIELDAHGRYAVLLGSTQSAGMPLDLFATGEPRWLGAKVELPGEVEQPRVLLVSVPYALKASDADTVGGIPASAFVLAPTGSGASAAASAPGSAKSKTTKSEVKPQFTSSGTVNYIPLFTDSSGDLGNSNIYQSATGNYVINAPSGGNVLNSTNFSDQDMIVALTAPGASDKHAYFGPGTNTNLTLGVGGVEKMRINSAGNVGIGYSNPQQRLVIGAPAGGAVLNATNLADQDLQVVLSAPGASSKYTYFGPSVATNLTLGVGLTEMMRITNAGNVGIGTKTPAATLEVNGTAKFDGLVSFASGQTLPGAATLGANTFTGNQTVNGNLSATGLVTGTAFNIGSNLFASGSYANYNAFLGFAGNTTTTGIANTASGYHALYSNTTGANNTASGESALFNNTTGVDNVANGMGAVYSNTKGSGNTGDGYYALYNSATGNYNTASGYMALYNNTTGSNNTASGSQALYSNTTGSYNTANGDYTLYSNTTASNNTSNGYYALYSNTTGAANTASGGNTLYSNTTGSGNTADGTSALAANTTGTNNTASGASALQSNTTGNNNTASGVNALESNTTGGSNTASGQGALYSNTTGVGNTASGAQALEYNTIGIDNTAIGDAALLDNTTGGGNTAVGLEALGSNTTGSDNIAIGNQAGVFATTGSNNIYIGNLGVAAEQSTIRIGNTGTQFATFIAGISGATSGSGVGVFVNSAGQLGTATSSRRYKEQIVDLGGESDILMKLRPVAFYYKPALDSTHTRQYGLVAEEVAQVAPDLVVFGQDGQPQTVRYHFVNAMLLNEVQKQHMQIEAQARQIQALKEESTELRQQLQVVLFQVKQIRDQVEAASAEPDNATGNSPREASALASAAGQRRSSTN